MLIWHTYLENMQNWQSDCATYDQSKATTWQPLNGEEGSTSWEKGAKRIKLLSSAPKKNVIVYQHIN